MMQEKEQRKNEQRGSLTVEAILFLIPFMCAFLTLVNIARYVQAELIIHHAITQTAKQISTYSYVLTKSEISKEIQESAEKSDKFQTDTKKAIDDVSGLFSSMNSMANGSGNIGDVIEASQNAGSTLTEYFKNPDDIVTGVFALAQSGMERKVLTGVAGAITGMNVKTAISKVSGGRSADEYLEDIGIVDGLEGLNFSKTNWISNYGGKGNIQIVVTYKLKNLLFPEFGFRETEFCQCASTLIW